MLRHILTNFCCDSSFKTKGGDALQVIYSSEIWWLNYLQCREETKKSMPNKHPSTQKKHKNPRIDLKRIIFIRKKSDPLSEIVVVEKRGNTTIISNSDNTARAKINTKPGTVIMSMGCCNNIEESRNFVNESLSNTGR